MVIKRIKNNALIFEGAFETKHIIKMPLLKRFLLVCLRYIIKRLLIS